MSVTRVLTHFFYSVSVITQLPITSNNFQQFYFNFFRCAVHYCDTNCGIFDYESPDVSAEAVCVQLTLHIASDFRCTERLAHTFIKLTQHFHGHGGR